MSDGTIIAGQAHHAQRYPPRSRLSSLPWHGDCRGEGGGWHDYCIGVPVARGGSQNAVGPPPYRGEHSKTV